MQPQLPPVALAQPPRRIFYGWWIVLIGCLQDAVKGGTFNMGFSLYFLPVLNDLNLTRAATSLPFSLAKFESALAGPLIGYLIDRFDIRVMLVAGNVFGWAGVCAPGLYHHLLYLCPGVYGVVGVGISSRLQPRSMAAVNYWFRAKRGLAISILQTGQAIGGVVLVPLVALAVLHLGWRSAAIFSGILVFLTLPLVLLIRRSPESMGFLPDGDPPPDSAHSVSALESGLSLKTGLS